MNSLRVSDNTKIINEGRILAVGAGKLRSNSGDDKITGLELESKGAIVVGSGKNLHLVDAKFKVSGTKADVALYAQDSMTLQNPTFNLGAKSSIFMEATTVNLRDVNFPGGSKITMVSKEGGTEDGISGSGKYPRFGTAETGRVNFIENVRYNTNLIDSKGAFDAHGGNITIRKPGF